MNGVSCECGCTFKSSKNMNKTFQRHLTSERHKIMMNGGSVKIHEAIVVCRGKITGYKNQMKKLKEGTESWNNFDRLLKQDQAELEELESKWLKTKPQVIT